MKIDSIFTAIVASAALYLVFTWGALSVQLKIFPYKYIENALIGISVVKTDYSDMEVLYASNRYHLPLFDGFIGRVGVTVNTKEAYGGYTLYSNSYDHVVRLIDMDGVEAHSWNLNPLEKLPYPDHAKKNMAADELGIRDAYLYGNGDVIVVYEAMNQFQNNFGLAKFNKNSELIWFHAGRNHHYIDVAPNGDVYTLSLDIQTGYLEAENTEHLSWPSFDEFIEVLDHNGGLKKRVSIYKAIEKSSEAQLYLEMLWPKGKRGDHLHPNTAHYITRVAAESSPLFEEGQVMVSSQASSAIMVVDIDKEELVWVGKGLWEGQHNTVVLDNGHIMLFDNLGAKKLKQSRVMEYNPQTNDYKVIYSGSKEAPLFSPFCSSFQILANGNTLITSHYNGRIFEINEHSEIVWEYFIPIRNLDNELETASVYTGKRYNGLELNFLVEKD
tara:strand:+ start:178604 stop:179929 length:1326 start_codon:yes stop_codon:yes gene_type:complete